MTTYEKILKKFELPDDVKSPYKLKHFKRYDMAGMFKELGYKVGAEIGVYKGEYSEILCVQNPNLKLYCIDPWTVYETKENEFYSQNQEALDSFYEETKQRLAPYNCEIVKKTSMEAVEDFAPNSLDFVYIDANHDFDHVTEDLREWAKIVRTDGIVSGHDYGHYKHKDRSLGAKKAIDNYVGEHGVKLFLVNRNFQTSWFFVK